MMLEKSRVTPSENPQILHLQWFFLEINSPSNPEYDIKSV